MATASWLEDGVYSYAEAARLLGITRQRLARWVDGYFYPRRAGEGFSAPVLHAPAHRRGVLTFPELMELFFVREFVALGVSLQHIRKTAEALAREVGESDKGTSVGYKKSAAWGKFHPL